MKSYLFTVAFVMFSLLGFSSYEASAQSQEPVDLNVLAEEEADKYQRILKLEDWQVFYVDSTLKHDYAALMAEAEKLQASKVTNPSMYIAVQDKWMDKIEETYRRIFTEAQWAAYLKTGAAKAQKARAKRQASTTK